MIKNIDAQEAALGLLGLSPNLHISSTKMNGTTATATSTIPTKRKQGAISGGEGEYLSTTTTNDATSACNTDLDISSEALDCICAFSNDDGFSIACDACSRWCHMACFSIAPEQVPDQFLCWECTPETLEVDELRERAVRVQRERLGHIGEPERQRRNQSPGVERKPRKSSIVEGGGGKKKRRPSMVQPPPPTVPLPQEDDHVEIEEPWMQSYVDIAQDIVSHPDTRAKLRRYAQDWRGVTAVAPAPTTVREITLISAQNPALGIHSNPEVVPPTYALHTTSPVPSNRFIAPYRSSITPSASYLSDPLNAYAHLGLPKPFVHLLGPPLDLALDARLAGSSSRFVRNGCRPNAILRPVLCGRGDDALSFGVFALRDLKPNEEIVLGWEWDDGNVVHHLPALLSTPHLFPSQHVQHLRHQMAGILHALASTFTTCACGSRTRDCVVTQMAKFVDGGERHEHPHRHRRSTDSEMESEDEVDLGPLIGLKRGFRTKEKVPFSGGLGGMEMCSDDPGPSTSTGVIPPLPTFVLDRASPSPLRPNRKGKGRAKVEDADVDMEGTVGPRHRRKSPIFSNSMTESHESSHTHIPLSMHTHTPSPFTQPSSKDLRPPDPGPGPGHDEEEDRMPPKMRKRWMHREAEALTSRATSDSSLLSGKGLPRGREKGEKGKEKGRSRVGLGIRFQGVDVDGMDVDVDVNVDSSLDQRHPRSTLNTMNGMNEMPPPVIPPLRHSPSNAEPSSSQPPSSSLFSSSYATSTSTSTVTSHLHPRPVSPPGNPLSATSPSMSFARLSLVSPALVADAIVVNSQARPSWWCPSPEHRCYSSSPSPTPSPHIISHPFRRLQTQPQTDTPTGPQPEFWDQHRVLSPSPNTSLRSQSQAQEPESQSSHQHQLGNPHQPCLIPERDECQAQPPSDTLGGSQHVPEESKSRCQPPNSPHGYLIREKAWDSQIHVVGHWGMGAAPEWQDCREREEANRNLLAGLPRPFFDAYGCLRTPLPGAVNEEGKMDTEDTLGDSRARASVRHHDDRDCDLVRAKEVETGWAEAKKRVWKELTEDEGSKIAVMREEEEEGSDECEEQEARTPGQHEHSSSNSSCLVISPDGVVGVTDMEVEEVKADAFIGTVVQGAMKLRVVSQEDEVRERDETPLEDMAPKTQEHQEPCPERPTSPPPLPKVKLSLRDFAARKKKQREEMEKSGVDVGRGVDSPIVDSHRVLDPAAEKADPMEGTANESAGAVSSPPPPIQPPNICPLTDVVRGEDVEMIAEPQDVLNPASPLVLNGHAPSTMPSIPPPVKNFKRPSPAPQHCPPSLLPPAHQAKQELSDPPLPSAPIDIPSKHKSPFANSPNQRNPSTYLYNLGSVSPINPDPSASPFSHFRSPSQEDGEIGETPPPPLSSRQETRSGPTLRSGSQFMAFGSLSENSHSRSPPTQPRSFGSPTPIAPSNAPIGKPLYMRIDPLPAPTPAHAFPRPNQGPSSTGTVSDLNGRRNSPARLHRGFNRTPPQAPRAMMARVSGTNPNPIAKSNTGSASAPHTNSSTSSALGSNVPRGPSASRERERDSDRWERDRYNRDRDRDRPLERKGSGYGWTR